VIAPICIGVGPFEEGGGFSGFKYEGGMNAFFDLK
jgi:hypothetical protein